MFLFGDGLGEALGEHDIVPDQAALLLVLAVARLLERRRHACLMRKQAEAVGAAGHDQCPKEDDQCVVGCVVERSSETPAVPAEFACASEGGGRPVWKSKFRGRSDSRQIGSVSTTFPRGY